jgi:transposase-like protein
MARIRQTARRYLVTKAAKRSDLTMAALARQLGCSRQMLYMVLDGERRSDRLERALEACFPDEIGRWPFHGSMEVV